MENQTLETAKAIGLTLESLETRKRYAALVLEEVFLKSIGQYVAPYADEIINKFYSHILKYEFVASKLRSSSLVERLNLNQ